MSGCFGNSQEDQHFENQIPDECETTSKYYTFMVSGDSEQTLDFHQALLDDIHLIDENVKDTLELQFIGDSVNFELFIDEDLEVELDTFIYNLAKEFKLGLK